MNNLSAERTAAAPICMPSTLVTEHPKDNLFRVLSLDGGGAKGFYTLGILHEIEAMLNCPLYKRFDLVFGTSTGAIIAALIALGYEVDQIHALYKKHVPDVMKERSPARKSAALSKLAKEIFKETKFDAVKTGVGIVTTRWLIETPMIFKGSVAQAHGRHGSFIPGFGVPIGEAVEASCSAVPFFERKSVTTAAGDIVELIDGGYCANNPTLYAIADALQAIKAPREDVRIISLGVGTFPEPKPSWKMRLAKRHVASVELLQKTLAVNTQSMEQLRSILFKDIKTVRISDTFTKPELATDFMEYDLTKLNLLRQEGRVSYAARETEIREYLFGQHAP